MAYTALVAGSTGAVGRHVVAELVASVKCAKVIALTRREVPPTEWAATFPSMDTTAACDKLEVRAVDFDSLGEREIKTDDGIDAVFSCLGTTYKDGVEGARKVDLHYTTRIGELGKNANASYFGLVPCSGISVNAWGFPYIKNTREVEANITALGFARTGFFHPAVLKRDDLARTIERICLYIFPSNSARAVAKAMVVDYETGHSNSEWSYAAMKQFE